MPSDSANEKTKTEPTPTIIDRIASNRLTKLASFIDKGSLDLTLPDGSRTLIQGTQPGPSAQLHVRRSRALLRFLVNGGVGFAEGYINGDWQTDDLAKLLTLLDANEPTEDQGYYGSIPARMMRRLQHLWRPNNRKGSKRNIQAHYDLGNDFFEAWLDPSMTYSSARFVGEDTDLEKAQRAKHEQLCQMIDLKPDMSILEIGCGWGSFALAAAKRFGAQVTGITISPSQYDNARRRVFEEGLNERVEIRLQDYRDVPETYDRIASIEMFEAVGEAYWPTYFRSLRHRLKSGGLAGLQIITIAERHFEAYRRNADFIQTYIFPGGMLPSPKTLAAEQNKAGLEQVKQQSFGLDYAKTLALWTERFHQAWPAIADQGFDTYFRRVWHYYLAYCEAGFRTGSTDVVQVALKRGA